MDFIILGTFLDCKLSFLSYVNIDYVFKKWMHRLYLLRWLNSFGVSKHILEVVYKSLVESVLSFIITVW